MVRRRPATVIGALCLSIAMVGTPVAWGEAVDMGPRGVVTDLPQLSELPPLPAHGTSTEEGDEAGSSPFGMSGVQSVALGLAAAALVVGAMGLAYVTYRGRGDLPDWQTGGAGPAGEQRSR